MRISVYKRAFGKATAAAGFFLLLLALLLIFTHAVGTNHKLYMQLQLRYNVQEPHQQQLNAALADYLQGNSSSLLQTGAFNQKELLHMQDVFQLFVLLRWAVVALLLLSGLLIFTGLYVHGPNRLQGAAIAGAMGSALLLLFAAVLAVAISQNFSQLFIKFHQLVFDNDLWLLNPATDVLIRLCPEGMFRDMALRIAMYTAASALAIPVLPAALYKLFRRPSHEV